MLAGFDSTSNRSRPYNMTASLLIVYTVFISAVFAMEAGSWTDIYLRAGGQMNDKVVQTVRQSSSSLDRILEGHFGHVPSQADRTVLSGSTSSASQPSIVAGEDGLMQNSAEEAFQSAVIRQRIYFLENVEAILDDRSGRLLAMSVYPSRIETTEFLYSLLASHHVAQRTDLMYHLQEDLFLTKLVAPVQDLAFIMPLLPTDTSSNLILVWKQDSLLVQSNLRLLGAIHLSQSRDEHAVFSGLAEYKLPASVMGQHSQVPKHSELSEPRAVSLVAEPEIENGFKDVIIPASRMASVEQLVKQVLSNSGLPLDKFSEVVLDIRTGLPPSDFKTYGEMVLEHLSKPRKHLYLADKHIVATKLDLTTESLALWTGEDVAGYGIVFWQVDAAWQKLTFHGLARIASYSLLSRCLRTSTQYIFVRPSTMKVTSDRIIHGQLTRARNKNRV